jgi:hypothetical protein
VLTGAQATVEKQCDDGKERWRFELSARAKEGERELESEGERCGVLRGVALALYRGRESAGEAAMSGNRRWLMELTPLMVRRG